MSEDMKTQLSKAFNIPMKEDHKKDKTNYPKQEKNVNPKPQGQHGGKEMPNRYLPLYKDFKKTDYTKPRTMKDSAHTGLLFDKFCDHWSGPEKNWKPEPPKKDKAVKQKFLDDIVNQLKNNTATNDLLTQYHVRRDALVSAAGGKTEVFKTSWRLVSGLGMGHVIETGFVWHRILGVPYLPGSSVKGLIRSWAEQWEGAGKDEVIRLFGPRGEDAQRNPSAGNLIVFDAIPVKKPELEVDIMNPHYAPYYKDKTIPPADYHSPVPIFFLTVKAGVQFKFSLAPRHGGNAYDDDVELGFELLKCALENIGIGAKTAVGYGYFVVGDK